VLSFLIVLSMAARFEDHGNGVFFLTVWFMFCSFMLELLRRDGYSSIA